MKHQSSHFLRATLIAIVATASLVGTVATDAKGPPNRATECGFILPETLFPVGSNAVNPACAIHTGGTYQESYIDAELYNLCDLTGRSAFKNESDQMGLMSKTIDAAMKIEQEKFDPDAWQKIEDYIYKLDSLESGDLSIVTSIGGPKSKAKIDEYDKTQLMYAAHDVKECLEYIIMPQTYLEPTVTEPTVTESTVAESTVAEPTVAEPTVTEPTTTESTVTQP